MPRTAALLADEMGLGKTAQAILSLRLLFHQGHDSAAALLVAPKPLIHNWGRELKLCGRRTCRSRCSRPTPRCGRPPGCGPTARSSSSTTRPSPATPRCVSDPRVRFDVVLLDEAQRIKNRRLEDGRGGAERPAGRSWALTGTPIENSHEDLVNIFAVR